MKNWTSKLLLRFKIDGKSSGKFKTLACYFYGIFDLKSMFLDDQNQADSFRGQLGDLGPIWDKLMIVLL